jgi:hypothetical protein
MSYKKIAFVAVILLPAVHSRAVPPPQILERQVVRIIAPQLHGEIPGRVGPIAIPSGRRVNTKGEHVQLLNGDLLRGKFIGFDAKKGMRWKHPHIDSELLIAPGSVGTLAFKATAPPENARQHACKIKLLNGDVLSGELIRMENGKLVLDTWYAGELEIDQSTITSLVPGFTKDKVFFDGPTDNKNWTQTNGTWKLQNRSFSTASSGAMLGRHIDNTPKRAAIDFEIDWASSLNLYVNFRTDSLNSYSACNGYCLRLTQTYVYLYRYTFNNGAGRGQRLGTSSVRINLNGANRNARVSIRVDERNRLIALYINGKYISKWVDTGGFAGKGNGLLFSSRTTNRIGLSQIRVSEWNGNLSGQNRTVPGNVKDDFVLFTNDDSISGNLKSIKDGRMKIKTSFGELPVPLEKVDVIYMAQGRAKATQTVAGSVRVSLHGKGIMSLQIMEWKDGKVTAESPVFGKAILDAAAIQQATFNIGTTRTSSIGNIKPTPPLPRIQQNVDPFRNIIELQRKINPR